jgi:hypothetical protein
MSEGKILGKLKLVQEMGMYKKVMGERMRWGPGPTGPVPGQEVWIAMGGSWEPQKASEPRFVFGDQFSPSGYSKPLLHSLHLRISTVMKRCQSN